MYFKATVTKWVDRRDSSNRKTLLDKTGSREFILNPTRITNLLPNGDPIVIGSKFFYCDNSTGRKEGLSYLEINEYVADVKTAIDTPFTSKFYTIPVHKNNDPSKPTTDITIQAESLIYVDKYNPFPSHKCWVVYMASAFKREEVLCDLDFEDIIGYIGVMTWDSTVVTWDSTIVTFDQV